MRSSKSAAPRSRRFYGRAYRRDIRISHPATGVVQLTLHRPEVRNALRTQTLAEIAAELTAATNDDAVRAVVLTGGLQCFAAGADVREMAQLGPLELLLHERQRHWRTIATFPKPLIAGVCGYALGGGCELALACDLIVAGNTHVRPARRNLGITRVPAGPARLARTLGRP